MHPVLLRYGDFVLYSHNVVLLLAFVVAGLVRRSESKRLGYSAQPGYRWVAVGALLGAIVGAKLGMLMYVEPSQWRALLIDALHLETSGKTVIGALAGGYAGVEIAKKLAGVHTSTGDAFAMAVPLSLAIGRVACFLGGCCYGTPSDHAWAVHMAGAQRHPVQLYEAALDLVLAFAVYRTRNASLAAGQLFKLALIGYAIIRIALDPWRGDFRLWLGPVSLVQWTCLVAIVALGLAMLRTRNANAGANADVDGAANA